MALYIKPQWEAGTDKEELTIPNYVFDWSEAHFAGKLVNIVPYFDFTFSAERAGYTKSSPIFAPGLVFENIPSLEGSLPNDSLLGAIVLSPFSVIMPGSLYKVHQVLDAYC